MKKGGGGGGGLKEELRLRGEQGGSVHSATFHCFQMLLGFSLLPFCLHICSSHLPWTVSENSLMQLPYSVIYCEFP